jgi:leucyl aminopeptidase
MEEMKFDMCGAAAVLGTMKFVAERKLPLRVVGLIASTHNMPDGAAYKPGDILTSMAGVTIEVKNTDAEGRLILVDTLAYAKRYEPDAVVDLATLTGACVIALGSHACGIMGNDEWLLDTVYDAGTAAGERAWPLPLTAEYREMVKSDVADIKNTAGRAAGAITAGAFLGAFTNDYRWTHMDIAGTAWNQTGKSWLTTGGTGAGVRLLAEMLTSWKMPRGKGPKPGLRTSLREVPPKKDETPAEETPKRTPPVRKRKTARKKTTRRKP